MKISCSYYSCLRPGESLPLLLTKGGQIAEAFNCRESCLLKTFQKNLVEKILLLASKQVPGMSGAVSPVLCLHFVIYLSHWPYETGRVTSLSEMKKPRLGEFQEFTRSHMASKQRSQDSNLGI